MAIYQATIQTGQGSRYHRKFEFPRLETLDQLKILEEEINEYIEINVDSFDHEQIWFTGELNLL